MSFLNKFSFCLIAISLLYPLSNSSAADLDRMALISAGDFTMGASTGSNADADEFPNHRVHLGSYYIDKYEVTNFEYKKYIDSMKKTAPSNWVAGSYVIGMDKYPVFNVSWEDASGYCTWKGKRLPSEAEWEKAARGNDERVYPWGNKNEINKARIMENGDGRTPVEVGSYEAGRSPYGVYDMAGNVWEWTADYYEPYREVDRKNNELYGKKFRVIRGGSAHFDLYSARATKRNILFPSYRYFLVGFRCAFSK